MSCDYLPIEAESCKGDVALPNSIIATVRMICSTQSVVGTKVYLLHENMYYKLISVQVQ
jgi:hypothetical protein